MLVWVTDVTPAAPWGPHAGAEDLEGLIFIVSTGRGNLLELSAAAHFPAEKHPFVDVDDLHIITQALRGSILVGGEGPGEPPAGEFGKRAGKRLRRNSCLEQRPGLRTQKLSQGHTPTGHHRGPTTWAEDEGLGLKHLRAEAPYQSRGFGEV